MQVIITADIHNGAPDKLEDTIWSMEIIRRYALEKDIKKVFILGDLFHDRVSINIAVLSAVYDQLKSAKDSGQEWICFPGNHDMFLRNSWDITALHSLKDVLTVIEEESEFWVMGRQFWVLPFIHQEKTYMERFKEIEKKIKGDEVLLTHIGMNGAKFNNCFLLQNWSIVDLTKSRFSRIYAGHFHCHQQVGEKIWYPGSPIPFRFDEGIVSHGFFIYDTSRNKHEFIDIFEAGKEFSSYRPPDYLTIVDEDLLESIGCVKDNKVRVILSKDYTDHELDNIRKAVKEKGGAVSVDWQQPKEDIREEDVKEDFSEVGSPDEIFKAWLEHDKPDLETSILMAVHEQILREAQEKYSVAESE
jgi:DNA repair exonuclease SbcCD nuclease subunit